eukprot:CFRG3472T1
MLLLSLFGVHGRLAVDEDARVQAGFELSNVGTPDAQLLDGDLTGGAYWSEFGLGSVGARDAQLFDGDVNDGAYLTDDKDAFRYED